MASSHTRTMVLSKAECFFHLGSQHQACHVDVRGWLRGLMWLILRMCQEGRWRVHIFRCFIRFLSIWFGHHFQNCREWGQSRFARASSRRWLFSARGMRFCWSLKAFVTVSLSGVKWSLCDANNGHCGTCPTQPRFCDTHQQHWNCIGPKGFAWSCICIAHVDCQISSMFPTPCLQQHQPFFLGCPCDFEAPGPPQKKLTELPHPDWS